MRRFVVFVCGLLHSGSITESKGEGTYVWGLAWGQEAHSSSLGGSASSSREGAEAGYRI